MCFRIYDELQTKNLFKKNEEIFRTISVQNFICHDQLKKIGVEVKLGAESANYRPDMFFVFNQILFVIEFKCRLDRETEEINSIKCIQSKHYSARIIRDGDFSADITHVLELGMALGASSIDCVAHYTEKSSLCDNSSEFLDKISLTKNKKRFKNSGK